MRTNLHTHTPASAGASQDVTTQPAAVQAAWQLYLSRPEEAAAAAAAIINVADTQNRHELGWGFLIRGLASCRALEQTFEATAVRANFATARVYFSTSGNARGTRLTALCEGAIAMRQGNWPLARREFEALVGQFDLNLLDADNFYILFGLSTAYVYEGRLEESLRFGYAGMHLASQLELEAEFAAIALPLGVALMAAKDTEEADILFETAIDAATNARSPVLLKTLRNNRSVTLRRMLRWDEAYAILCSIENDTTAMIGGQHFLHYNAAELHLKRGDAEAADRHFASAQRLLAAQGASGLDLVKLHYVEGAIANHCGQLDAAITAFNKVDRMLPEVSALRFDDRAEFYDQYADVLARANRHKEAFEIQRKSSEHYLLGITVVNRVRRFSQQIRQEIGRVSAELHSESNERLKLLASNLALQSQVGKALSEAEILREKASHDGLTSLFNRRHLDETLPKLLTLSQQAATPFSLVMIDLDHFKQVNDGYGHEMGDHVLREFGRLTREILRGSDIVGRYGGEEFCLCLIGSGPFATLERVDALLKNFRQARFQSDGKTLTSVTFSAGIAVYPEDGINLAQLSLCADKRLLKAKTLGRARALAVDRVAA